jgi:predicted molibdopterin-dependent oxidoreductase YjgC
MRRAHPHLERAEGMLSCLAFVCLPASETLHENGTAALNERGTEAAIRVRKAIGSTRPNSDFRLERSLG